MKSAKKLLCALLALTMLFAMTACGSEPKGSVTPSDNSTPAPSESTPAPEATPEPEEDVEPGSVSGATYENDFVGIGCNLDESWSYMSEEELLEMNGIVADSVDDEELAEQLRDSDSFYDMVAMSEDGMANVNVVIENLGLLYGATLSSEDYVDVALETLEGSLVSLGMSDGKCEKTSFTFCGQEADGIKIEGTMSAQGVEIPVYQLMACVKSGSYMCVVTACSYVDNTTADVLDMFYAA